MSFTTRQLSELSGIEMNMICHVVKGAGLKPLRTISKNQYVWDNDSLDVVKAYAERRKAFKDAKEKSKLEAKRETTEVEDSNKHPLVTDSRCLMMNYWPDPTPRGYEDVVY